MMKIGRTALFISLLVTASCSNESGVPPGLSQSDINVVIDSKEDVPSFNETSDVDLCTGVEKLDLSWCSCYPGCCDAQMWFCQPTYGDPAYYKNEVIVNVCNDELIPCLYGVDHDCPPPEILHMGECTEAYECPPGSQSLDYGWQWCETLDGAAGKQHVTCDKGQLYTSPCQPCLPEVCDNLDNDCDGLVDEDLIPGVCENECGVGNAICINGVLECFGPQPQEEICDGLDNDCDDLVDEDQTNVCGSCGSVPAEMCNGWDDDCDGLIDEDLVDLCSTACGTGAQVCINGNWGGCTAQQPSAEICNGLDDDCNGQIDDGISCVCTVQDIGKLFPCAESPLLCGQGYKTCECANPECLEITTTECFAICHWLTDPPGLDPTCDPLVGTPLAEEECNNFDDNCNMLVDEDLVAVCYIGPEGTLNVGICLPGNMVCELGVWGGYDQTGQFISSMCVDEVLPKYESCNGIDDDCDGLVDWGEEVPETDILFIVDWSGSMVGEIDAVLIALNQFALEYALQDKLQWGLVVGPRQVPGDFEERLFMVSDVSPFADFLASFSSLGNAGMSTGSEMLLDALYMSLHNVSGISLYDISQMSWQWVGESVPPKEQFNISWRPGANKVVIVFSDEIAQSYLIPKLSMSDIIQTCSAVPQLKTYAFSTNEFWDWDEMANTCGGKYYPLKDDSTEMYGYLMEILDEICSAPSGN